MRQRISVVSKNHDVLSEDLDIQDNSVVMRGNGQFIQRRWTIERNVTLPTSSLEATRITWKRAKNCQQNILEPTLINGLNVYVGNRTESNGPMLPNFKLVHADEFDEDMIYDKLPEVATILQKFDEGLADLDIQVEGATIKVDEYFQVETDSLVKVKIDEHLSKLEAGFFSVESEDNTEVTLNGVRCMWLENGTIDKCQQTMLFYQQAHIRRPIDSRTPLTLRQPVGLHPNVAIDLREHDNKTQCEFFSYITLPRELFVDKYQSSPVFLHGSQDLELPEYKLPADVWGSETMFRLQPGIENEIKLHSRYVRPVDGVAVNTASFDLLVFKACDSGSSSVRENPFYSKGLGFEAYFTEDTVFTHLNTTKIEVSIPAGNMNDYHFFQLTTVLCVVVSLVYLFAKFFKNT
ncbi:LAMI_0F00562g1_1 [Lachancea mirantina]|uniref:Protein PBN1 n=1 Tax=Lachancea mirantina TaxID=1230905 RepID=A0A1G4JVP0_9SACH|nr:LAMI_0F00562g1_1 [Lachancea mirantina]